MADNPDVLELVKDLTDAIHAGDNDTAEKIVIILAKSNMKLNINVEKESTDQAKESSFEITVQVEDRESSGAKFKLFVKPKDTIQDLKRRVSIKYGFPFKVQRWIIGKKIPNDTDKLGHCGVVSPTTVFLYLLPAHSVGLKQHDRPKQRIGIEDNYEDAAEVYLEMDSNGSSLTEMNEMLMTNPTIIQGSRLKPEESFDDDDPSFDGEINNDQFMQSKLPWEMDDDEEEEEQQLNYWDCLACTYKNQLSDKNCAMCNAAKVSKTSDNTKTHDQGDGLKIGDRVVWRLENGLQKGTVRWIGTLPDMEAGEITVGVELDNQVGTGTGIYKDQRFFYSRPGHASFVPLYALIKSEME